MRRDPIYWARHCYRIRDKDLQLVPLKANHAQRKLQAAIDDNPWVYGLKARQGGISTYMQAHNLHTAWSTPRADVITLAHNRDATDKIFRITRRAIENFPPELLPKVGGAQTREVSFPGLDSAFWTGTAGATRTGRGLTLKAMHGSEFAFWDEPMTTLNAIMPGLVPGASTVVLETTASAYGSEPHEFWLDSQKGKTGFTALFLPWWICDFEKYRLPLGAPDELGALSDEETELVNRYGLDMEQVKWRRQTMARMGRTTFLQEYAEDPNSCWLVAGEMFYDGEVLRVLWERRQEPKTHMDVTFFGWSGKIAVYGWQEGFDHEKERVIIGCDTAEGGGGDRSTYVARTYPSWRLLERFGDTKITPKALAALLNQRGRYHNAYLVVEKNGHGITVLRELRDTHKYPQSRIFHRQAFDEATRKPTVKIGWATTEATKPLLLDAGRELFNAALAGRADVPSAEAITDGFNVKRDERGRADIGGRDELVAEMLAWCGRESASTGYASFMASI